MFSVIDIAHVAPQEIRVPHRRNRARKRFRDRLLHLCFLQSNAELTTEQLGEVSRLVGAKHLEGIAHDGAPRAWTCGRAPKSAA